MIPIDRMNIEWINGIVNEYYRTKKLLNCDFLTILIMSPLKKSLKKISTAQMTCKFIKDMQLTDLESINLLFLSS